MGCIKYSLVVHPLVCSLALRFLCSLQLLPRLVVLVGQVRPADGVPESEEGAVVSHVVGVVIVVYVSARTKREVLKRDKPEIVATVSVYALQRPDHQPHPQGPDVGTEQEGPQEDPRGINECVFQRVGIFDCPAVGLLVLVVEFVDVLVEE